MAGYENVILADTNILIEVFKGNASVITSVQQAGPENLALSSVTVMELYYGALNRLELQRIRKNLGTFHIIHISAAISKIATHLIERHAKSHNLQIPEHLSPQLPWKPIATADIECQRFPIHHWFISQIISSKHLT